MTGPDLLGHGVPETLLPANQAADEALAAGADAAEVAAAHPTASVAWAVLAEAALADGRVIEGYAYARVGYHRGLDALRGNGWRGIGPVPWSHLPNQGFLRCLSALSTAAGRIGESEEQERCRQFLVNCDPQAPAPIA